MAEAVRLQEAASTPPYAPVRRNLAFGLRQFLRLVRVMMSEYRETWWIHAVFGFMFPLGMIFFLKSAMTEVTPERAIFLIGGNMTTSITYGPTMILINRLGWGKQFRTFDYWTALPLPKLSLMLAMIAVALFLSLPGLLGVYLLGSLMLQMPLSGGVALLLLVPLGTISLSGFGAFLGAYARDGQSANVMANILLGVVTFASPLMIPTEAMPAFMRVTSKLIPTTYVADAFRAALSGQYDGAFALNVGVVVAICAGFLVLVQRKLDWRSE